MKRIDRLALKFDEAYLAGEVDQFELPPYGSSFAAGYRQALEDAARVAIDMRDKELAHWGMAAIHEEETFSRRIERDIRALADREE